MKINEKVEKALNKQINAEFYSAYQYLAMAAHFEEATFKGFAHWMRLQSEEEVSHAMKLYNYLIDRGGRVVLNAIEGPRNQWNSILELVEEAYLHEQKVTEMINSLVDLAKDEKDHATNVFLHWFITEQIEEESNASDLVAQVKRAGDSAQALFILDKELATRQNG